MAADNVEKFAAELKLPVETLIEQLQAAGVAKSSPADALTEADKEQLLNSLRKAHGAAEPTRKKITLTNEFVAEGAHDIGGGKLGFEHRVDELAPGLEQHAAGVEQLHQAELAEFEAAP